MRDKTEKVTINLSVVDLGKIEFLVDNGFYANRTDFIKAAVRRQLDRHHTPIERAAESKHYVVGMSFFGSEDLKKVRADARQLTVRVIGLASFAPDVTPELVRDTITSFKTFGVVRASAAVKRVLQELEPEY